MPRPRLVGINHVALEVTDLDQALAFYGRIFEILPGQRLNFRDPWGNHLQVVDYRAIQFTKAPAVLASMGLEGLAKRPSALPGAKGWR